MSRENEMSDRQIQLLKKAQAYAASNGGSLVSEKYETAKTKMDWKCAKEHPSWLASADSVVNKTWCPLCVKEENQQKQRDLFLKNAQEVAEGKGGTLLSTEFISAKTQMMWQCSRPDHKPFSACLDKVKTRNQWCQLCSDFGAEWDVAREKSMNYAKENGGFVIFPKDVEIIKSATKLTWKCAKIDHKPWQAEYRNIISGGWCPECAGRFTPEEFVEKAHNFAKEHGGECFTNSYEDQNSRFIFKCSVPEHNEFSGTYYIIQTGVWCKECKKTSAPVMAYKEEKLQKAKEHANSRGGECLSTEFKTTDSQLKWKCNKGHTWNAKFSNVVGTLQRWCPECANKNYKETMSRYILEKLLGFSLDQSNPSWNINPSTNRKLELDGYNEKNKFAFEFQGEQHFKPTIFTKSSDDFIKMQQRDLQKKINCKNNDVFLLEIFDINIKNIHCLTKNIIELLEQHKIPYNKNIDLTSLKKDTVYFTNTTKQKDFLEKAKKYAISRGGKCLSNVYINAHSKLEWKCKNDDHASWFAPITIINRNNWCWKCYIKA